MTPEEMKILFGVNQPENQEPIKKDGPMQTKNLWDVEYTIEDMNTGKLQHKKNFFMTKGNSLDDILTLISYQNYSPGYRQQIDKAVYLGEVTGFYD